MKRNIIVDYIDYSLTDDRVFVENEKVAYQIKDATGREYFAIGEIGNLQGSMVEKIWSIESEEDLTDSIFPEGVEYDDEYYKSNYHPTIEEEEAARKLFEELENTEQNGGN
jgi:hypothetical protein